MADGETFEDVRHGVDQGLVLHHLHACPVTESCVARISVYDIEVGASRSEQGINPQNACFIATNFEGGTARNESKGCARRQANVPRPRRLR